MTTQEMIDWLQRPVWERTHRREADAIAARLKALEALRAVAEENANYGLNHSGNRQTARAFRAILDTVREVE